MSMDVIKVEDSSESVDIDAIGPRWKVLVIDDDPDVHLVTRHVLSQTRIFGRPLTLIEASNASQAKEKLLRHPDVAVILLDVVMEEHDSGLKLTRWIRQAGWSIPRIVLRTGQPGYAPDLEIVRNFDINDYQLKSDLTQAKLLMSLTLAIRSFEQISKLAGRDIEHSS